MLGHARRTRVHHGGCRAAAPAVGPPTRAAGAAPPASGGAHPGYGPTALSPDEQRALADIRDGLERADPAVARELGELGKPAVWRWWATTAAVLAAVTVALLTWGAVALGIVILLLVLGAPLAVAAAVAPPGGPRAPAE